MKKILIKIGVFSIISVIVVFLNTLLATAEDGELQKISQYAVDAANPDKDWQCIKKTEVDEGWIITIIEEPLSFEKDEDASDNFLSRPCYRNYLTWTDSNKKEHTSSEVLKECQVTKQGFTEGGTYKVKFGCKQVQAFLSKGGTTLIYGYISTIYKWAASIVGVIAVLVIIISGIQISAAGGDTQAIENAKNRIVKSLAGIAVLFLSGLILYTINPTFFTK